MKKLLAVFRIEALLFLRDFYGFLFYLCFSSPDAVALWKHLWK